MLFGSFLITKHARSSVRYEEHVSRIYYVPDFVVFGRKLAGKKRIPFHLLLPETQIMYSDRISLPLPLLSRSPSPLSLSLSHSTPTLSPIGLPHSRLKQHRFMLVCHTKENSLKTIHVSKCVFVLLSLTLLIPLHKYQS